MKQLALPFRMACSPHPWIFLAMLMGFASPGFASMIERSFSYSSYGEREQLSISFSDELLQHYTAKPRTYDYARYAVEDTGYNICKALAEAFQSRAKEREMSQWELVNMVVDFVQSLEYQSEIGEYPKYPVETLVDGGGDCEDTSILLAGILDNLMVDCILLSPPGHMAVGIAAKGLDSKRYLFLGKQYFYTETTGSNWDIGKIPDQYTGAAKVYALPSGSKGKKVLEAAPMPKLEVITIAFHRVATPEKDIFPDRKAYKYKVNLEAPEFTMKSIEQVQYRRIHPLFDEFKQNGWMVAYSAQDGFSKEWQGWEYVPVRVRILFKDGSFTEQLVRFEEGQMLMD